MIEVYSALCRVQEVERLRTGRQRHFQEKIPGISDSSFQFEPKMDPERVRRHTAAYHHCAVTRPKFENLRRSNEDHAWRAKYFNRCGFSVKCGII